MPFLLARLQSSPSSSPNQGLAFGAACQSAGESDAVAIRKPVGSQQLPNSPLLVDMEDPIQSIALDLNAEDAPNWAEFAHFVLSMQELLQVANSVGWRREEKHVIGI